LSAKHHQHTLKARHYYMSQLYDAKYYHLNNHLLKPCHPNYYLDEEILQIFHRQQGRQENSIQKHY
jgi:hypothetical protein